MKNTPTEDIKAMFFAQYWNQQYQYKNSFGTYKGSMSDKQSLYYFNSNLEHSVLLLKPIGLMSDDDFKQIPISERISKEKFIDLCLDENEECRHLWSDHLRKIGYLTDWLEYSIEDLLSFGWVKLIKK